MMIDKIIEEISKSDKFSLQEKIDFFNSCAELCWLPIVKELYLNTAIELEKLNE